jgi:hypothetical protein
MMTFEQEILAQLNYKIAEHNKAAADHNRKAETLEDFRRYVERKIDDYAKRAQSSGEVDAE